MSRLMGWGRYRTEAYPGTGSAGGAGAAAVPLQRQRFIDGDTPQTGLNGSAAEPFKTIAQFMASRTDNSVADVTANYVGWLMPALGGYIENVAFPHFSSTELRADSLSLTGGTVITGDVTWPNTLGGGGDAATTAVVTMHNISVTGSFTVTDGVEAPTSIVVYGGDEIGRGSATLGGGFISNTTQKLAEVILYNTSIQDDVLVGTGDLNAVLAMFNCSMNGDITARGLSIFDSTVGASTITLNANIGASFINTAFTSATTLTSANGARFDGDSWQSFVENGGTRAAGTFALVVGGYSGGAVEGAVLTGASTSVSLNGTGATAGYTGENSGNHYTTSNGTPTTVTLKTGGGELPGDTILITKTDLGANVLAVKNNATATIGTIPTLSRGFVLARFDGSDWVFAEGGSMLA